MTKRTGNYPYDFTEGELMEGCKRCIDNVKGLLHSASLLLDNSASQQYALGLYMYAIEEYGKAILLRNYITRDRDKYQIPGWILGKEMLVIKDINDDRVLINLLSHLQDNPKIKPRVPAHFPKLLIGSNHLPPECSWITRGVKISTPIPSPRVLDLGSDRKVSPIRGTTGIFSDSIAPFYDQEKMTFIEVDLKTLCFYMDWDKINKTWKYDVSPDQEQLKKI
jgi:hypothetical protein